MSKYFLVGLFLVLFLTLGCNSNPTLCECVELGDEVNQLSSSLFTRDVTQEGRDSLVKAIACRDSFCATYMSMSAEDLNEAKSTCGNLDVNRLD